MRSSLITGATHEGTMPKSSAHTSILVVATSAGSFFMASSRQKSS